MNPSKISRPSTNPSVVKDSLNTPTQEQEANATRTPRRNSASKIGAKISQSVANVFKRNRGSPQPQLSNPSNATSSTSASSPQTSATTSSTSEPRPLPAAWHKQYNEWRAAGKSGDPPVVYSAAENEAWATQVKKVSSEVLSFSIEEKDSRKNDNMVVDSSDEESEPDTYRSAVADSGLDFVLGRTADELPAVVNKEATINKGKRKAEEETEAPQPPVVIPRLRVKAMKRTGAASSSSAKDKKEVPDSMDDGSESSVDNTEVAPVKARRTNGTNSSSAPHLIVQEVKKLPPGHEATHAEDHDRNHIPIGTPKPEAKTIVVQTEKKDPNDEDVVLARATVTHEYTKEVDWNSASSVKALNKWRGQIFSRAFGPKKDRRWTYTEGEANALYDITKAHLATPEVGGFLVNANWEAITAEYNQHFSGVIQRAGEPYASVTYHDENGVRTSVSGQKLKKDRDAPVRSLTGLKNQILHFKDQRVKDLIRNAKGVKQEDGTVADVDDHQTSSSKSKSSPSSGSDQSSKVKRIVINFGDRKAVLSPKGSDEDDDEAEEPPQKKRKSDSSENTLSSGYLLKGLQSRYDHDVDQRLPRDVRLPPVNAQGRHPLPDAPLRLPTAKVGPRTLPWMRQKRSRDADESEEEDDQDAPSPKKVKLNPTQGRPLLPAAPRPESAAVANPQPGRATTLARRVITNKGIQTTARLPTLDDYFAGN